MVNSVKQGKSTDVSLIYRRDEVVVHLDQSSFSRVMLAVG